MSVLCEADVNVGRSLIFLIFLITSDEFKPKLCILRSTDLFKGEESTKPGF